MRWHARRDSTFSADHPMPANNRTLVWRREGGADRMSTDCAARDPRRHPHHPRLPAARGDVPRHHHAARQRARVPRSGGAAGAAVARRDASTVSPASRRAASFSAARIAHQLAAGFVPIRKKGKLPHTTVRVAYSLEYGLDEMEMHRDAVAPGERIILVDDLIATGGTAEAAVQAAALARRRTSSRPASSSICRTSEARSGLPRWRCRCGRW